MQFKSFMEMLKGKQHKLDKNKNGKLDAEDFKALRKEETEQTEESYDFNRAALAKQRLMNLRKAGGRVRGATLANLMRAAGIREEELDDQDLDQLDEVLGKDATASDWISDFVHSDNPKFEGKSKKERIKMALGAYYNTTKKKDGISEDRVIEEVSQIDETPKVDRGLSDDQKIAARAKRGTNKRGFKIGNTTGGQWWGKTEPSPFKDSSVEKSGERKGMITKSAINQTKDAIRSRLNKEEVESLHSYVQGEDRRSGMKEETDTSEKHEMAETQLHFIKYAAEEILEYIKMGGEIEEWYQNKLSKVQSELESLHSYVEGESRRTGMKEETDKLLEYTTGPGGVTRIQGRGYGAAKGAKYGSTDYDRESLDKNDDESETSQPQKRGRGRPAGSKSGARGPRIKEQYDEDFSLDEAKSTRWFHYAVMKNADTGKYHSSSVNAYGNTVAHKTGFDSAEEAEQHGKKISSIGGGRTQAFHDSDVTHKNFKKVVKEQYDEEGNISYSKLSYKDFVDQLLEYTTGPGGVTRIQGRGYGNAKGAKYGSTDYDRENLDKNDDEGESSQPQKRGRGRPAGSKSGARGPRIK